MSLQRRIINSTGAPQPMGAYSQAVGVNHGEMVYLAGQVSTDAAGNLVGPGDVAAQTRQVYENLGAVLREVGATFANVVEFTTYLVGRESVAPFMGARAEIFPTLFPDGDYPANTLLLISGLVREEFLVEVKAVAALPA